MKWIDPIEGSVRQHITFLLFPLKLQGETRWLEWVCIEQLAVKSRDEFGQDYVYWQDVKFISPPYEQSNYTRGS